MLESRFPLVGIIKRTAKPSGHLNDSLSESMVMCSELPLLAQAKARIHSFDAETTTVSVPAHHAAMANFLIELSRNGDLSATAWSKVDPVALLSAAAFFQVHDLQNLVELVHHRTCVARSCPAIAHAIASDSLERTNIQQGKPPVPGVTLIALPLGMDHLPRHHDVPLHQPSSNVPRFICPWPTSNTYSSFKWPTVTSISAKLAKYHILDVLKAFPDNVVVGGGFVASALLMNLGVVPNQDVDLFVWGCDVNRANEIVDDIYRILRRSTTAAVTAFATRYAFTFRIADSNMSPAIVIQVVRRIYPSFYEIPHGFDIAASSAVFRYDRGLDTIQSHVTSSFIVAAELGAVWIDPTRQSASYAWRLLKYWARGLNVMLFGMDQRIANMDAIGVSSSGMGIGPGLGIRSKHGLAVILAIEHLALKNNITSTASSYTTHRSMMLLNSLRIGLPTSCYEDTISADMLTTFEHRASLSPAALEGVVHPDIQPLYSGDTSHRFNMNAIYPWVTRSPGGQVTSSFDPEKTPFYTGTITRPYDVL